MKKQQYDFSSYDFSRIAVIGCAGSGKTTFSKSIGKLLCQEVTHLDKILWGENWTELSMDQKLAIQSEATAKPHWIIDGMWCSTLPTRYPHATLVIFLDYKISLCLWRAIKRSIKHHGKQRDDLALGCVEKLDWSFYKYIANFNKHTRKTIESCANDNPQIPMIKLKSPKQTKIFLQQLQDFLTQK